jgi:hypothetical protein
MLALARLAAIFEGVLPTHKSNAASPQVEIADIESPPRVQITVSPQRVPNESTPPRVVQPTATHITKQNSHQSLSATPLRAVTPSTPHSMIWRSEIRQNLSNDMLSETVQQANHLFSLPVGPAIRSPTSTIKNTPVIIISEMTNAVICPDTASRTHHHVDLQH